jgi:D-amino peptidase
MRVYIMTDLEGVAGVLNFADWCLPESRYYELAKELLTREVNAAVDGFFAGGATAIMVADGHGAGAINPVLLDTRVELMRGFAMGWPFLLDEGYDAVAWVGQHAKSGTAFAHLAHTQWFNYLDLSVNGVSIGEFGQFALCASELGVRSIFLSGDRAGCAEAQALVPGIETVEVKRGTTPGTGDELDAQAYRARNTGAVHRHPEAARAAIRAGAERAILRAKIESFGLIPPQPPFERTARFRADGETPPRTSVRRHPSSVVAVMNDRGGEASGD